MSFKFNLTNILRCVQFQICEKKNYLESYLPSSHFMGLHFILNSERTVLKFCAFVVLSSFPCIFIGFALCLYISSFIIPCKKIHDLFVKCLLVYWYKKPSCDI